MRRICYQVAMSLDGYIAGPNGEYEWIIMDPDIDFSAIMKPFDTILIGRHSYELAGGNADKPMMGMKTVIVSKTIDPNERTRTTIIGGDLENEVRALKAEPGKDIWLFGGGVLFRSLAELGLVDSVEVAVIPVLLGGGIPLFPAPASQLNLQLTGQKVYDKTGTVSLKYAVK